MNKKLRKIVVYGNLRKFFPRTVFSVSVWVNETDWDELDTMMINFEKSFWNFVKNKNLNVFEVDKINMDCNIFGRGNPQKIKI